MASDQLTNLRGKDPGANRQTDAIARLVTPVCQAVMRTPIMGAAPPAWVVPDLNAGWANYGQGYAPFRYHVDVLGYLHVEGLIVNNSAGTLYTITTLPAGMRPSLITASAASVWGPGLPSAHMMFRVTSAGLSLIREGVPATYLCSFSMSFLAEQ